MQLDTLKMLHDRSCHKYTIQNELHLVLQWYCYCHEIFRIANIIKRWFWFTMYFFFLNLLLENNKQNNKNNIGEFLPLSP